MVTPLQAIIEKTQPYGIEVNYDKGSPIIGDGATYDNAVNLCDGGLFYK